MVVFTSEIERFELLLFLNAIEGIMRAQRFEDVKSGSLPHSEMQKELVLQSRQVLGEHHLSESVERRDNYLAIRMTLETMVYNPAASG